jgi:hypothetical protein
MSAIVRALDNHTPQQLGENGHVEYSWSNNIQEQILQFTFQIVRSDISNMIELMHKLRDILVNLQYKLTNSNIVEKQIAKEYLSILYKTIGQTRDVIDGKGEYELTYMMIYTWYEFYPVLALFALRCLVELDDIHQYGSWKDIKYFCNYCKKQGLELKHPLIQHSIKLINNQLLKDKQSFDNDKKNISLVSKWIPREKSKFRWIYQELATNFFAKYLDTAIGDLKYDKAILKAKTEYRQLISKLNKEIDTLQIKQCGKDWAEINFDKVTSISLTKQKKAFLNVNKNGNIRFPDNEDRNECAQNFKSHIHRAVTGEIEMKGKRIGMADFTKQARYLYQNKNNNKNTTQLEIDLLNSQWRDNSSLNSELDNMIAMVDISGSMTFDDAINVAVALGIRVAEKSKLGKRVMTFSAVPKWINLDAYPNFVDQVEAIENGDIGLNTDFSKALNLILDSIVENKMHPSDVENLILSIFSDMQIDNAEGIYNYDKSNEEAFRNSYKNREAMYKEITIKFSEAGIRVHGIPYNPPHILFWNLRTTTGFPCLSNEKNVSMMSGYSPTLLNDFCNKGIKALQYCTPWSSLISSLENNRYKVLSDKLNEEIVV